MMNSLNLTLSEKHSIFPSILNDSFAGYSNQVTYLQGLPDWAQTSSSKGGCLVCQPAVTVLGEPACKAVEGGMSCLGNNPAATIMT